MRPQRHADDNLTNNLFAWGEDKMLELEIEQRLIPFDFFF